MSSDEAQQKQTVRASVDLADLLSVTISSKQLELVLEGILGRLAALETKKDGDDSNNGASSNKANDDDADQKNNKNNEGNEDKDWTDVINQLRSDLDKERERSDNQQAAINDLEEKAEATAAAIDSHEKALEALKEADAGLEERKADKSDNNDDNDEEKANQQQLEALKKRLADLEDANSALAARVATLEGLAAAADPNAAKEQGLSSFTDTLNDVLKKQKELEAAVGGGDDSSSGNGNLSDRLAALEAAEKKNNSDVDALKKDLANANSKNNNNNANANAAAPASAPSSAVMDGVLGDLDALKKALKDLQQQQQRRASNTGGNNNNTAGDNNNNNSNNANDLAAAVDLEPRVAALEAAADALRKGLADHKADTAKRFGAVEGDVEDLKDSLGNAVKEIKALGQECSRNTADCKLLHDKKADKGDAAAAASSSSPASARAVTTPHPPTTTAAGSSDSNNNNNNGVANLERLLEALESRVSGLAQDKAGKDALGQATRDIADLKNTLANLQRGIEAAMAGGNNNNNNASLLAAAANGANNNNNSAAAAADQLAKDVAALKERMDALEQWARGELVEIRATVDHIHHSKADAAIVANKAERDYVENAMEKLMQEVENVLNATNAGLIDTLDKSLNILRDMIDGKATKQDINKIQGMMNNNNSNNSNGAGGEVPDGLATFKAYRCLGCNRTMDSMRPRPMGSTMSGFTNRVPPASGRNAPASSQGLRPATLIQQQQQQQQALPAPPGTPPTASGTGAGFIANK